MLVYIHLHIVIKTYKCGIQGIECIYRHLSIPVLSLILVMTMFGHAIRDITEIFDMYPCYMSSIPSEFLLKDRRLNGKGHYWQHFQQQSANKTVQIQMFGLNLIWAVTVTSQDKEQRVEIKKNTASNSCCSGATVKKTETSTATYLAKEKHKVLYIVLVENKLFSLNDSSDSSPVVASSPVRLGQSSFSRPDLQRILCSVTQLFSSCRKPPPPPHHHQHQQLSSPQGSGEDLPKYLFCSSPIIHHTMSLLPSKHQRFTFNWNIIQNALIACFWVSHNPDFMQL